MRRKIAALYISLIIFASSIMILVEEAKYVDASTTHYVGGVGPGNYSTIQLAINNAATGDTVFVYNGTYHENVAINKIINLTGEDNDNTTIDGNGNGDVIHVSSNWVNVTGFNVTGSGGMGIDAGIKLNDVENCTIENNRLIDNGRGGIYLHFSDNNHIIGNYGSNNVHSIFLLNSSKNIIEDNNAFSNNWYGLSLTYSNRNFIKNNTASIINLYGINIYYSNENDISNNNVSLNTRHGIYIYNSYTNIITNNNAFNNDNGIYLWYSSGNTLYDNTAYSNNFNGVHIRDSHNNRVMGNNVSNNEHGIYLEDSNENIIENNYVTNILDGIHLNTSNTNNVILNKIHDNSDGIHMEFSSNNTILKNNISSSRGQGVYLSDSAGVIIRENKIFSGINDGIYSASSSNNSLFNNEIYKNKRYGIWFRESSNENTVTNNKIYLNEMFGCTLYNSSNNSIIGNNLAQNNNENIGLYESSDNNLILQNDISSVITGINLDSSNNTITMNKIYSNIWAGIFAGDASYNLIIKNNILDNDYGIYLTSNSHYNRIYHNNLINNVNQAKDDMDDNFWNDSYPSGGNYWSDYNGIDLNSTPSQDVPPPDGIGDTPYIIDLDSQDNYPFMDPFFNSSFLHEGWNLISVPLIQTDTKIQSVLSSLIGAYDAVQWYKRNDVLDPWKHNHSLKPGQLNDFKDIDHIIGFWIHIIEPGGVYFNFSGTPPASNQTIQLHPGWNMVGYPSKSTHNRTVGLNNLTYGPQIDCIQWYDTPTKTWHFMGPDDNFVPGRGYLLHSKVTAVWEVPI